VSQFFGCTPLGPLAWAVVTGSAGATTIAAVVADRLIPVAADREEGRTPDPDRPSLLPTPELV